MVNLNAFIMKGLRDAVGKADEYWIRLTAAGWHAKGELSMADLAEISAKLEALHPAEEVAAE